MNGHHDHCRREPRARGRRTKRLLRIRIPDYANQDHDHWVGEFRAENLVAILRAIPQTDGTYSAVATKAREYGSTVLASTLDEWIQEGRDDLIAGDSETAFARFATAYEERKRLPGGRTNGYQHPQNAAIPRTSPTAAPRGR